MILRRQGWVLAGALLLVSCSDSELPLDPVGDGSLAPGVPAAATVAAPPEDGVGTFGEIVTIKPQEQGLVLYQTGFDVEEVPGSTLKQAKHDLAVGARHAKLQVQIKDDTEILIDGEPAGVGDLEVGMNVLVVGRVTGAALHADQIMDLSTAEAPPEEGVSFGQTVTSAPSPGPSIVPSVAAGLTSTCMGQRLPDQGPDVLEYQGCWGGFSAADYLSPGFIPVFCPLIGCVGMDRFSYTAALAGWGFAFPMRFQAVTAQNLVYHVPGDVALGIDPLGADPAFSFWGGLGLEFGIRFRFCSFFGCYNLGTVHLSVFSSIQQSSGPAPLTGQVLDIATTSCPSVGLIPIEGFPLDPLSIGFCQDLDLDGAGFRTRVQALGGGPAWSRTESFGPDPLTRSVRPDAMAVNMRFSDFDWVPDLRQGLFFRLKVFSIPVFDTPSIPLGSGPWNAITTPFPASGSVFSLATDPLSPVDDLRYLDQPTQVTLGLEVDPAPTVLTIISGELLEEGTPVMVRLQEEYDGSPIAGHPVLIEARGLMGIPSVAATPNTAADGTATLMLPPGEYDIRASYAGAETYLPSSDQMEPVYVYRPTSFAVWGGNVAGIQIGARYQFWGSGWTDQVVGGEYGGNASFQGYCTELDDVTWTSPPAASGDMPATLPDVISVIVTTRVSGRGSRATGDIAARAVLRVDEPGAYRPAGGHPAWGVVRAMLP